VFNNTQVALGLRSVPWCGVVFDPHHQTGVTLIKDVLVDGQMAVGGIGLQGTDAYPAMGVMDQSQPQLAVDGTQPPPESDMQPPSVHAQMGNQMYPATQEAPLTLDEAPVGQYGGQMEQQYGQMDGSMMKMENQPDMGHIPPTNGVMNSKYEQMVPTNGVTYPTNGATTYPTNGIQFGANSMDGTGMTVVQTGQPQYFNTTAELGIPQYDGNGADVQEFVMKEDGSYVPLNQTSGHAQGAGYPAGAPATIPSRQVEYM